MKQTKITIKKKEQIPFLEIGIQQWKEAYKRINSLSAFALYLYLASNHDSYSLEMSPEVMQRELSFTKGMYYRSLRTLSQLGYISQIANKLYFTIEPKAELEA